MSCVLRAMSGGVQHRHEYAVEVRVRDDMIEVDVIDFDDPNWPRRTLSRRW